MAAVTALIITVGGRVHEPDGNVIHLCSWLPQEDTNSYYLLVREIYSLAPGDLHSKEEDEIDNSRFVVTKGIGKYLV